MRARKEAAIDIDVANRSLAIMLGVQSPNAQASAH